MNAKPLELPRDDFAERCLVGALLIGRTGNYVAADHLGDLETVDVFQPHEQEILRAVLNLRERGEVIDAGTVVAELDRTGKILPLWPSAHECVTDLMRRMDEAPVAWHVEDWARRIRAAAVKRKALEISWRVHRALSNPGSDHDAIAHDAAQIAELVRTTGGKSRGPVVTKLADATKGFLENIRADRAPLIETGLPELDSALCGGVEFGEMMIVAGRPSHGKSAVGQQMIHHATGQGFPSAYFSEEMSADRLGKRTVQFASDVHQEHWGVRLANVQQDLDIHFHDRAPCFIVENSRTAVAVAEKIRRLAKDDGVRFVVVDYLQLLSGRGRTRYEQVTDASITLRQVCNETGILLVALCQLSREIEKRSPMIPHVSDLKESGQLEQDADVIVFLVWPHRIDSSNDPKVFQFFVAKNRNREIVTPAIVCKFEPSRQRIVTMPAERSHEPDYSRGWN